MKPITIGIGSSSSGAGKTTVAEALLKHFTNPPSPPFAKRGMGGLWGAIKYTKTAIYTSLIDDKEILAQENKDTHRFMDAGAEDVLWIQSPPEGLKEVLPLAISRLSHLKGIIIEGNSAIEFLKPDIVIFIIGKDEENFKESAMRVLEIADVILFQEGRGVRLPEKATKIKIGLPSMSGFDGCIEHINRLLNMSP